MPNESALALGREVRHTSFVGCVTERMVGLEESSSPKGKTPPISPIGEIALRSLVRRRASLVYLGQSPPGTSHGEVRLYSIIAATFDVAFFGAHME